MSNLHTPTQPICLRKCGVYSCLDYLLFVNVRQREFVIEEGKSGTLKMHHIRRNVSHGVETIKANRKVIGMKKVRHRLLLLLVILTFPLAVWGCGGNSGSNSSTPGPQGGIPPGMPPQGKGPRGDSKTRQIMTKIGKGPSSLSSLLEQELKADPLQWKTIQAHTAEYAKLSADLAGGSPPKGSKESWAKLTSAFAKSATDLDKAAQAKDASAALAAHKTLRRSCAACHREHRGGRGGFGGFGRRGGPQPPG